MFRAASAARQQAQGVLLGQDWGSLLGGVLHRPSMQSNQSIKLYSNQSEDLSLSINQFNPKSSKYPIDQVSGLID